MTLTLKTVLIVPAPIIAASPIISGIQQIPEWSIWLPVAPLAAFVMIGPDK
ncbi:hypothetical protein [Cribrihabitans pelagius]|uniref:hypothetical protein n=1 Tax=Cribrihabitans pelagius TaxID=1765746 RepID=UPI003B5B9289